MNRYRSDCPTFGDWLLKLRERKARTVSQSTLRNFDIVYRLHVPDELKAKRLDKITADDLDQAIYAITASRMRQYAFQLYNEAFERAVWCDLIGRNPLRLVDVPKHKQKRGKALTEIERREFKRKIKRSPLRLLFEFYLWSGCRRNEALSLEWRDVDPIGGMIYIHGTKTADSDRVLPISPKLQTILDQIPREGDKLFYYSPDYVTKTFKRLCPNHKLHDLRHTFATRCLECGISDKVVSQWLGHSDISVTLNYYSHVLDDFQRREALKLRG